MQNKLVQAGALLAKALEIDPSLQCARQNIIKLGIVPPIQVKTN